MDKLALRNSSFAGALLALLLTLPAPSAAQVPVDATGQSIASAATEEIPLLSAIELAELVGPIALYPDDLLAIVLPATTYPLQLVQAQRFLDDLKIDAALKPDDDWDESVVALLNYPEVIELLTDELDQTWRLGEAVVAQQADVVAAVESFRDRAYAAGNLQSDSRQTVTQTDGTIEIKPVAEDVIYVPYYEPERVVVYQSRPAYYYYPRPYPVYYYPYPYGHAFNHGFFWGVTTAFAVGWYTDSLHVYHHSYYGHPYYGHNYYHNHWYRHANVHVHNNYYYGGHSGHHGNHWYPHSGSTVSHHDQRVTRSRQYRGTATGSSSYQASASRPSASRPSASSRSDIQFRERDAVRQTQSRTVSTTRSSSKAISSRSDIHFRERSGATRSAPAVQSTQRSADSGKSSRASQQRTYTSEASRPSQPRSYTSEASRPSRERSHADKASSPSRSSSPSQRSTYSSKPSRPSQPQRSASSGSRSEKVASSARSKGDRGASSRR